MLRNYIIEQSELELGFQNGAFLFSYNSHIFVTAHCFQLCIKPTNYCLLGMLEEYFECHFAGVNNGTHACVSTEGFFSLAYIIDQRVENAGLRGRCQQVHLYKGVPCPDSPFRPIVSKAFFSEGAGLLQGRHIVFHLTVRRWEGRQCRNLLLTTHEEAGHGARNKEASCSLWDSL